MHEIEKCNRFLITSTTTENLRPVRRTRLLVGNRYSRSAPSVNFYSHNLMAVDVFLQYLFALPIRRPDAQSVVKGLLSIFTRHAYVPKHILTDKGTTFPAELLTELAKAADIHISLATIKHAQAIGMVERSQVTLS